MIGRPWLLIGATGSLGTQLVPILLARSERYGFGRLRLLSRGEHAQTRSKRTLQHEKIDWFIGDVRDKDRMLRASKDCETVINLVALKSIDICEYDPYEAVQTNILGAKNVIEACKANDVVRAMFTSTDKACAPLNLYGATKLVAEKLWIQANVGSETKFSAVRYGNVLGSNGSVLEKWKQGPPYEVTDPDMTRFWMTQRQAAEFVRTSIEVMKGGEIFIPKIKASTIGDLLTVAVGEFGRKKAKTIGIRPGEKMHEALFSEEESHLVTELGDRYVRWPSHKLWPFKRYGDPIQPRTYSSDSVDRYSVRELEVMCQT